MSAPCAKSSHQAHRRARRRRLGEAGVLQRPAGARRARAAGCEVRVEPAGSRQIATSIDLGKYDFAFPSSAPAADRIRRQRGINAEYTPFSSPMAIATFQPIADLLVKEGIAKRGTTWTFNVGRYLDLVSGRTQWNELEGNTAYPVRRNILVSRPIRVPPTPRPCTWPSPAGKPGPAW